MYKAPMDFPETDGRELDFIEVSNVITNHIFTDN